MNFSEFGGMGGDETSQPPYFTAGARLRKLRETTGLSRGELASKIQADVSSLVGWEGGKRLPRPKQRYKLARILGVEASALFASGTDSDESLTASLVDTLDDLPKYLVQQTRNTRTLRALSLVAPYGTAAHIQVEWRKLVDERLRDGTLEVQLVEIFYSLTRLQESLSNILRYDALRYYVKTYCAGFGEVAPFMGGYFFDEREIILCAYCTGVPSHKRHGLRLSGSPVSAYFHQYWDEIWQRGTFLNLHGAHDLSAVRVAAEKLGLPTGRWDEFVAGAKAFEIGDGAPPLI